MPTVDLTEGHVGRKMLRFSAPLLLSMLLQALYGLVDLLVAGNFCSGEVVNGIATAMQLPLILSNLIAGLAMGGSVVISQYFGAKNERAVKQTVSTVLIVSMALGVVLSVLALALMNPLLNLLQTPAESRSAALTYLSITLGGTVFVAGYNAVSAVLRGLGDSVNPLIFVTVSSCINGALDLLMVGALGWGAMGSALSTIIAQALSFVFVLLTLRKPAFRVLFERGQLRVFKDKLTQFLRIGLPASLQNTLVGISFFVLIALANSLEGANNVAILGFSGRINAFAILPNSAICSAIAAMAGQNIGAQRYDRARATMWTGIKLCVAFAVGIIAVVNWVPDLLLQAFTRDSYVLDGIPYLRIVSIDYLLTAFTFSMIGLFNGAGHTLFTMISALCGSWLFRVPMALLFASRYGLAGIAMGMVCATIAQLGLNAWYYASKRWTKPTVRTVLLVDAE